MMKDDDFKLLRGFDDDDDRRTNERTFVIVESLSRLKSQILKLTCCLSDVRYPWSTFQSGIFPRRIGVHSFNSQYINKN